MATLLQVIIFSTVGSLFSLIGGFLLLANKSNATKFADYATPFAAGALLAAAFVDLLPEAIEETNSTIALRSALFGIILFFILERFLHWFHHHHEHEDDAPHSRDSNIPLIIIGDTVHNFIDGAAIAAAFLVSFPTGVVTTLAVAAHEIPQEIGDFGLLLKRGMSRKNVILANVLSALATTVSATIFFLIGQYTQVRIDVLLAVSAGFFIYIAASDLIPSIHDNHHTDNNRHNKNLASQQTAMLLFGVAAVSSATIFLHKFI
jgi:zinc and cadmium transporter